MKTNYAVLTDSTSDLSPELRERFGIDDYLRGVISTPEQENVECDLEARDDAYFDNFYKKLKANPKGYKTAALGLGATKMRFRSWLEKGLDVLVVVVSSALSGVYKIAMEASKELLKDFPERKILVLDSRRYSLGVGILAIKAAEHRKEGLSIEENYRLLEEERDCLHQMGPIDDLYYVASKGRISNAKAFFGTIFGIKPMGDFSSEGMVQPLGKVNGIEKTYKVIIEYMKKTIKNPENQIILMSQTLRRKEAEKAAELIRKEIRPREVIVSNIYPNTGINCGPGLYVAFYYGTKIVDLEYEKKVFEDIVKKL